MKVMDARPTIYNGIRMRSRLEASFAQWLDFLGVEWRYEGDAFADRTGQYLPDFTVPKVGCNFDGVHDVGTLVIDVKPHEHGAIDTFERMRRVWSSIPSAVLVVAWPKGDWAPSVFAPWVGMALDSPDREPFNLFYGVDPECGHFTIGDGVTDECPQCFLMAKGRW
jgi:hypothetical protein